MSPYNQEGVSAGNSASPWGPQPLPDECNFKGDDTSQVSVCQTQGQDRELISMVRVEKKLRCPPTGRPWGRLPEGGSPGTLQDMED